MTSDIVPFIPEDNVTSLGVLAAKAHEEVKRLNNIDVPATEDLDPVEQKDILNTLQSEMDAAHKELTAAASELETAFKKQMEKLKAEMAPLQKKANEMKQAVDAINVYLGTDEDIILIRDGEEAPAGTPITVFQNVLFMDEEIALGKQINNLDGKLLDPGSEGWKTFDDWLLADKQNVEQVIPALKGIVGFRSARENRSNDPFKQLNGDGSEVSHLLIRNGEKLAWLIISYDLSLGDRLVPAIDEFDKFFEDRFNRNEDGSPKRLVPGSMGWSHALEKSKATQRHFLKIALALQGIVDRHTILAPLPEEKIWFTRPESYDSGRIILVTDEKVLPTGIMPYPEWRQITTRYAHTGSRVVVGTVPYDDDRTDRIRPKFADGPPVRTPLELKRRQNGEYYVSWKRTDKVWKRNVPDPDDPRYYYPNKMVDASGYASCTIYSLDEKWVLPLDHPAVTVEAIDYYLRSRDSRRHFVHMVPLLLSAKSVLEQEQTDEIPFRSLVISTAENTYPDSNHDLYEIVDNVIYWWKTKNKIHRALITSSETDDKAFIEIVNEINRRIAVMDMEDNPAILADIAVRVPEALYVGRNLKGEYVALEAADKHDVYVNVHSWTAKQGKYRLVSTWVVAPDVRSWRKISETKRFVTWPQYVDTSIHPTGIEEEIIVKRIRDDNPNIVFIARNRKSDYYGSWSWNYIAYSKNVEPSIDILHPLTGDNTPGSFITKQYSWYRSKESIDVKYDKWRQTTNVEVKTSKMTLQTKKDDYFHKSGFLNEKPVWVNEQLFTSLISEWGSIWENYVTVKTPLASLAECAVKSISEAWVERQTNIEYYKFIEKYGNQSVGRWKAHVETIKSKRLSFPYHRMDFIDFISALVETGVIVENESYLLDDLLKQTDLQLRLDENEIEKIKELTVSTTK